MSKSTKPPSEIDRLIELASDAKPSVEIPSGQPANLNRALSLEDKKDPQPSMWRILLQLRVLLPYMAKVLPLVERGLIGTNITGHALSGHSGPSVDTSHFDRGIAELEGAHRDVAGALKAQSREIKDLQEQVTWLGESIEKDVKSRQELTASLASLKKTGMIWAVVIVVLLGALLGLMAFAVFGHGVKVG